MLFLGTIALFSRALPYGFTNFDDPSYVTHNHHVQGGLTWSSMHWAFTGRTDYWHPLTWMSHMLDWQLFGDNATGHRVTSILWHALNAVLVFAVLRRLTGAWWTSAFCAALFAWHPLRVESVIWMPERKDVMSGCFFLLTVWSYVCYAEKRAARAPGTVLAYALTLAAFLAALMCKPVMVALPGVLVCLDFWPLRRLPWSVVAAPGAYSVVAGVVDPGPASSRPATGPAQNRAGAPAPESWRFHGREKLPFLALSVVIAIVTLVMQHTVGALASLPLSFSERVGNAVVSIPRYLGKFFWPVDLAVIYPHPGAWPVMHIVASGALVLALTALAVAQWRRRPWLLTGWGWFLVMLLPNIGLVQAGLQAMADRYTYIPVVGLQLALLWTLHAAITAPLARWIPAVAAGLVLVAVGVRTWDQQEVWRDPPTLFNHALAVTTDNYAAHTMLSVTVLSAGRIDEAEAHALRALAIRPDFGLALDAMAMVRRHQGRFDEAMAYLRQLIELMPHLALTHSDLGDLLLRTGRPDEAAAAYATAVRLNPELASPHVGLAKLAMARGDLPGAIAHYEEALALGPGIVEARNNLAALLTATGRWNEAAAHFLTAIALEPDMPEIRSNFASLLRDAGRPAEAVEQSRAAITLRPGDPDLYLGLARGLEQLGQGDEAMATYEHALQLEPGFAPALCGIGGLLVQRRQPEAAQRKFETALISDPRSGAAYAGLARVAEQLGRPDDVLAHLSRAVECAPGDAQLRSQFGDALARRGQMAEAVAQYEQGIRLRPGDAELHARLGYALMVLRRPADAIKSWEEALRLNPEFPGLRERIARARRGP